MESEKGNQIKKKLRKDKYPPSQLIIGVVLDNQESCGWLLFTKLRWPESSELRYAKRAKLRSGPIWQTAAALF